MAIITQNNLNEVIKANESNNNAVEAITASIIKTISNIANNKNAKNIDNNIKTFKKICGSITDYISLSKDLINVFCLDMPEGKNLDMLLGRIEEYDSKKNVKTTKYTIVDSINQLATVIESVKKTIESLSNIDFGFKALYKIKANIFLIKFTLSNLFKDMITMFSDLSKNIDVTSILNTLIKQPDITLTTLSNNISSEDNKTTDNSKTETKLIQGKLGLLDVFAQTFTLIGTLANLRAPKLFKLKIQLYKIKYALTDILSTLYEFINENITEKTNEAFKNLSVFILGDEKTDTGVHAGLVNIIQKINLLFNIISNVNVNKKIFKRFNISISRLNKSITAIANLVDSTTIKKFIDNNVSANIKKTNTNISSVVELFGQIAEAGKYSFALIIRYSNLLLAIHLVGNIIDKINTLSEKELKDTSVLDDLKSTIDKIVEVQSSNKNIKNISILKKFYINNIVSHVSHIIDIINELLEKELNISNIKLLDTFNTVIYKISEITKSIRSIKLITKLHAFIVIKTINNIVNIIEALQIFNKNKINKTSITTLNNVKLCIDNLFTISVKLNLLGRLALPAIISALAATVFVYALALFIKATRFLLKKIARLNINTIKNISIINALIGSLLLTGLAILALAAITPLIVKALVGNFLPFLGILALSMFIVYITIKLASTLSGKAAVSSISLGINVLIITGAFILAALTILIAGEVGKKMLESDSLINIGIGLLGIIVVSGIAIALGFALGAFMPVATIASVGIGSLVTLLGLILGAGLTIIALGKLKFDFGSYDKETNTGTGIKGNIGKIISFTSFLKEQLKSYTKDDKKALRQGKRLLRQVAGTVRKILRIGKNLFKIQGIEINTDEIGKRVGTVFNTVDTLIIKISKRGKDDKKTLRQGKRLLRQVKRTVGKISDIAESLNLIQNIELKDKVITDNVNKIFTFIQGLDRHIHNMLSTESNSALEKKDVKTFIKSSIKNILKSKKSIAETKIANEKLNIVEKVIFTLKDITESLKAISEFEITEEIKQKTVDSVGKIFEFIKELDTKIGTFIGNESFSVKKILGIEKTVAKKNEEAAERLNIAESITAALSNVIEHIKTIKEFEFEDTDKSKITGKTGTILSTITDLNNSINKTSSNLNFATIENISKFVSTFTDINSSVKEISNADTVKFKTNIDNYIRFVDKINTIQVDKLKTASDMFGQMSNFSNSIKGDFDKLSEALSEKLLPVITELKEVMTTLPDKIDIGFQNTSASIAATNAMPTKENVEAQIKRENPKMDQDLFNKLVNNRLNEKAQTEAGSMSAKLDELISLLKGMSGEHVVVQTI